MPSNFDELLSRLDAIAEQTEWCVSALKHLLASDAGIELPEVDEFDEWMDAEPDDEDQDHSATEFVAHRGPRQRKKPPCPHNRQAIDDEGNLICGRCGFRFGDTGLVQAKVTPTGQVQVISQPEWARQQSPGASSKNPGGFLAPHSG